MALPHPSNLQWTQIRDFQTQTQNPGLTFPKPENPGLQKEPGFGNSNCDVTPKPPNLACLHQQKLLGVKPTPHPYLKGLGPMHS